MKIDWKHIDSVTKGLRKLTKTLLKLDISLFYLCLFAFIVPIVLGAQIEFKDSELSGLVFEKGQVSIAKDELNNGYLITKKGYYSLSDFKFYPYKKPIDSLFGQINNIDDFNITAIEESIYLVNPSGGYVFEFDKNTIKRIDNSFNQRAYFNSRVFSYNNEIYLVGGYGYWEFKSHLLRFDFNLKEWLLVDILLDNNIGFYDIPLATVYEDKLYVASISLYDNFKSAIIPNENYIVYDFKSKTKKFVPIDYNEIFNYTKGIRATFENYFFPEKQNIFIYSRFPDPGFLILDFLDNSFYATEISSAGLESATRPIKINNYIYSLAQDKQGQNKFRLIRVEFSENKKLIGPFHSNTTLYLLLISILLASGVIGYFFWRKKTNFMLHQKKLTRGLNSIKIDYQEYYFLNYLFENNIIENQVLINYFDRDQKSYDLNVKRKNQMIEKLEYKIQSKFKTELFKKTVSPKDKRQGIYILVKKLSRG